MENNWQKPPTLKELRQTIKPIRNARTAFEEKIDPLEKYAMWMSNRIGTMGFFLIVLIWTTLWLVWNTTAPIEWRFDPFPAFVFWLFISNMLQLFLLPILLIGQNLQNKHTETRSEVDFETNLKAEKEIGLILTYLERQYELLEKAVNNKGKKK